MNFELLKFFIGLMNFFSIVLLGALLAWFLMGEVGPAVLGGIAMSGSTGRKMGPHSCSRVISSTTWPPYSASDWMSCTIWFNCS